MRNVLHVITDTNRRGAQVFATDLCALLCHDGSANRVVALVQGAAGAQLRVPVLGDHVRGRSTLRVLRREMAAASVVVAHGSATLLACSVAGLGLGVPVVYRNISDPEYWLSTVARRARVRLMLARVSRIVALWPGGAEYLVDRLGVEDSRITVIPNGVPVGDFRPPSPEERTVARGRFGLPQGSRVLVYVAAFQPEKHPETAVEALASLPQDVHLVMVGDGPLRGSVAELAERTAPGRVVIAGQIADPVQAYWAADLLVLPSEGEGLPAVLIEAALCGRPAVASTSGGNTDIVRHGVTGMVVDPVNAERIATAIETVLAHRDEMGRAADEHCRSRYDMARVAKHWQSVIDQEVDGPSRKVT